MKCTKNDHIFALLSHLRNFKDVFSIFPSIFSIRISFMNKIPKILGIFLKINELMENPDSVNNVNKAAVPNALGTMTLLSELLPLRKNFSKVHKILDEIRNIYDIITSTCIPIPSKGE